MSNVVTVSKKVPWAYPDILTICWGVWFVGVAIAGGHLPVLWYAPVEAHSWGLAVLGALLTLVGLSVERSIRLSAMRTPVDENALVQRRRHLKQVLPSMDVIPGARAADTVHLRLLVDWPVVEVIYVLHQSPASEHHLPIPERTMSREVRVDEGVVEFRLTNRGERIVVVGNFLDGTPTIAQYGYALMLLTTWQDTVGEPRWYPKFDPAANVRILPEGYPDPDVPQARETRGR